MRHDLGAYYWLPSPAAGGVAWDVLACHDLGRDADAGHVTLWPGVLAHLAAAWGVAPAPIIRRLGGCYAGLPRGRVSGSGRRRYLNHGGDSPRADGLAIVRGRFGLDRAGGLVVMAFDPHERMLRVDAGAVQRALGLDLGLRGI